MTMSQAATEPQAGPMSLSNGCDLDGKHLEAMDHSAGPATSDDRMHTDDDLQPGQLNCRRSTRVSALKAQEKIKIKDDIVGQEPGPATEIVENSAAAALEEPPNKKAKLANPKKMDQMSHTFYIQEQSDGTVIEIEEESDISSINEADATMLRHAYAKTIAKEPSEEVLRERQTLIKQLEADLRKEESELTLMRKIQTSQLIARQTEAKKAAGSVNMTNGGAYKPLTAVPKNGSTAKTGQNNHDAMRQLLQMPADAQKDFLTKAYKANPVVVQQLVKTIGSANIATQAQVNQLVASIQAAHQSSKEPAPVKSENTTAANIIKNFATATPAQRAAQARAAFRMQADKQLQQCVVQKTAFADLNFIPNPNQADFCSLVALDIIVQRIMKDKIAIADVTEDPYECEECHTDFTPSWKAIGIPGDMHLYCEACVRASQKKKSLKDQTNFLKKAFNKVNSQEKEFEKQITEGKLDQLFSQAAQQMNSSTGTNALKANGTSTPTPGKATATVIPNTSKLTGITAPSSSSAAKKSSSTSSSNMNNMSSMQMTMMMRNPMFTAMMSQVNPTAAAMMQQMYSPMMTAMMVQQMQMQQQANRGSSNNSAASQQQQNYAMLLAQAAMSAGSGSGGLPNMTQAQLSTLSSQLMQNPQMQRQFAELMRLKTQGNKK